MRSFQKPSGAPVAIKGYSRGANPNPEADREVKIFIWSFSALLVVFLGLLGGLPHFLAGLLIIPFFGAIQIALSKMGGSMVWAWTLAIFHCAVCFLWLALVVTN